ncbi:hypothetical protein CLF_110758 [Clonorchis sinensis]|uniref:Uncharacterized protein n=1 Tax=Clonorchis sinensis TaxID=79923 RepID=G7YTV1_CLOSI|nr:hypothetical protein CLF_110758 [Clonorchis sinensis]
MVAGLTSMDCETRLALLDLFPLEYRRLRGDLILTYALFEQGLANRFFTVDPANTRRGHGERQLLNDKNKTDPGNLGKSLAPVYQSVNPCSQESRKPRTDTELHDLPTSHNNWRKPEPTIPISAEQPQVILQQQQKQSEEVQMLLVESLMRNMSVNATKTAWSPSSSRDAAARPITEFNLDAEPGRTSEIWFKKYDDMFQRASNNDSDGAVLAARRICRCASSEGTLL